MRIDPESLQKYASELRRAAHDLEKTASDLEQAAGDNIGQCDVDLTGLYAAQTVSSEITPILERMG